MDSIIVVILVLIMTYSRTKEIKDKKVEVPKWEITGNNSKDEKAFRKLYDIIMSGGHI